MAEKEQNLGLTQKGQEERRRNLIRISFIFIFANKICFKILVFPYLHLLCTVVLWLSLIVRFCFAQKKELLKMSKLLFVSTF